MSASPRLSVRFPEKMLDAIRSRAKKQGVDVGEYVRRVMAEHLGMKAPEMLEGLAGASARTRKAASKAANAARWAGHEKKS